MNTTQQHTGEQYHQHIFGVLYPNSITWAMSVLRSFSLSRRVVISAVVSALLLLTTGVVMYETHTLPFFRLSSASAAGIPSEVSGSEAPIHAATVISHKATMHEMHIANTGLTLLRGATVISNTNGVIRVAMEWGNASFVWAVTTDSSTQFYDAKGEHETLNNVQVDDIVTITGMLTESGVQPTIHAQFVSE